eukprot:scaffold25473_cov53-Cyclotella_meneghiniana.AAC.4
MARQSYKLNPGCKLNPTDYKTLTSWLAQFGPDDELPPDLHFSLTPIQSSMGRILVLLANMVCDFDTTDAQVNVLSIQFTCDQQNQFTKLQSYYQIQRFKHLMSEEGHSAETAAAKMGTSLCRGTIMASTPHHLSPRMMIDDSEERMKVRRAFIRILENIAEEAEIELLKSLDVCESDDIMKKKSKKKKASSLPKQKKVKTEPNKKSPNDGTKDDKVNNNITVQPDSEKKNEPLTGKENTNDSTFAQIVATSQMKTVVQDTTKRVKFNKQLKSTKKQNKGSKEGQEEGSLVKGILRKPLSVDVPNTNDVVAHFIVPSKVYDDRVSETALPASYRESISADAITRSIIPPLSPNKSEHSTDFNFSIHTTEIEALKEENVRLRRKVASAGQYLTEAVQRVQLKAYIAETARDAAQERVKLLETLLYEVINGKIGGSELQDAIGQKNQTGSPTASSLSELLDRLPKDTMVHINSTRSLEPLPCELQTLSRLRNCGDT